MLLILCLTILYSVLLDSPAHDEPDIDVSMSVAGTGDDPDHGHDSAHNKADAGILMGMTGMDDDLDHCHDSDDKGADLIEEPQQLLFSLSYDMEIGMVPGKPFLYGSSQKRKLCASCEMGKLGVSISKESSPEQCGMLHPLPAIIRHPSPSAPHPLPSTSIIDPSKPINI